MIACTSPAGTCSDTPFRIGLSATVAWRLAMSSIGDSVLHNCIASCDGPQFTWTASVHLTVRISHLPEFTCFWFSIERLPATCVGGDVAHSQQRFSDFFFG